MRSSCCRASIFASPSAHTQSNNDCTCLPRACPVRAAGMQPAHLLPHMSTALLQTPYQSSPLSCTPHPCTAPNSDTCAHCRLWVRQHDQLRRGGAGHGQPGRLQDGGQDPFCQNSWAEGRLLQLCQPHGPRRAHAPAQSGAASPRGDHDSPWALWHPPARYCPPDCCM